MLRFILHLMALVPAAWLFIAALTEALGADPQKALLHELGIWALRFLLLSLAMTPLRLWTGRPFWISYRRMLGLYAFAYALLHFLAYFTFYLQFDVGNVLEEIAERPYITVGFAALLLLLPLVVTSTRRAMRALGRNWQRLHRLVYVVAVLAVLHFAWSMKAELNEPLIYAAVLAVLLHARWQVSGKRAEKQRALLATGE